MTSARKLLERFAPYVIRENVLSPEDVAELTDFAVTSEPLFEPPLAGAKGGDPRLDAAYRMALPGEAPACKAQS